MKRLIIDYKKISDKQKMLLAEKYPYGFTEKDIITFKNIKNETVEAIELQEDDTMYLIKINTRVIPDIDAFSDELLDIAVVKELNSLDEETEIDETEDTIDNSDNDLPDFYDGEEDDTDFAEDDY
jgi:DNA-directed RNA polymerase subunit delta